MGRRDRNQKSRKQDQSRRPAPSPLQPSEIAFTPTVSHPEVTAPSPGKDPAAILTLQRTAGNRAAQHLVQAGQDGTRKRGNRSERMPGATVQRQPNAGQSLEEAERILAECKRDLYYRQIKVALASPKGSPQRRMVKFPVDWRYGFTDYYAKISPMNKNQWEIYQGFARIRKTMIKYEDQIRSKQKDPTWKADTRAERAVAILKRFRYRFKRNPYSGLWTVWDKYGDIHFKYITNDQLLKVSKRMVRWATAKGISPITKQYKNGLTAENVRDDYNDLWSIKNTTERWRQDLKAARKICKQIISTFDPKTGLFKARDGWELKVLAEITIDENTRFKHILRSYTQARNRADARVMYIGLQPWAKQKAGSLEGDPKDPGISAAERRKLLKALDF